MTLCFFMPPVAKIKLCDLINTIVYCLYIYVDFLSSNKGIYLYLIFIILLFFTF